MSNRALRVHVVMERRWYQRLQPSVRRTENRLAQAVAVDARRYVGVDSGTLRRTIRARGNRVTVGTRYWRHHHEGTKPRLIEPRHKQALYWPGARHPVARVHHPGTRANPFMRRALYTKRTLKAEVR